MPLTRLIRVSHIYRNIDSPKGEFTGSSLKAVEVEIRFEIHGKVDIEPRFGIGIIGLPVGFLLGFRIKIVFLLGAGIKFRIWLRFRLLFRLKQE
jgi:hypothetical protein